MAPRDLWLRDLFSTLPDLFSLFGSTDLRSSSYSLCLFSFRFFYSSPPVHFLPACSTVFFLARFGSSPLPSSLPLLPPSTRQLTRPPLCSLSLSLLFSPSPSIIQYICLLYPCRLYLFSVFVIECKGFSERMRCVIQEDFQLQGSLVMSVISIKMLITHVISSRILDFDSQVVIGRTLQLSNTM